MKNWFWVLLGLLAFYLAGRIFLLVFASIILAVLLRGIVDWLARHTPLGKVASAILIFMILAALMTIGIILMPGIVSQFSRSTEVINVSVQRLERTVRGSELGNYIYLQASRNTSELLSAATSFFSGVLGFFADTLIVLAMGIYLAIDPRVYVENGIKLFRKKDRKRMQATLSEIGRSLRGWLLGRFLVMVIDGVGVTIALWILGIPLAVPFGILAGLLAFIPNLGPILSAVPALLVAYSIRPDLAIYTALAYMAVQFVENYLLGPLIDRMTVSLPPAFTIAFQLLASLLFGFLGLFLATPMAVAATILIKNLYVKD